MSTLNAGMTRDAAFELLSAHNHDPFHIEHAETVEQTMRYFARESTIRRTRNSGASWACCTTWTGRSMTTSPPCTPSTPPADRGGRRPE